MKKLSFKKTTLSRLNNVGMSKVKGGDYLDHDITTWGDSCVFAETQGCTTEGNGCKTEKTICAC